MPQEEDTTLPQGCCKRTEPELGRCCVRSSQPRFVEPVVLYLLKARPGTHGYELLGLLGDHALTDADIDSAALYRTLRQLEAERLVNSEWDTSNSGPPRRTYTLTSDGEARLAWWLMQLEQLRDAISGFVANARTPLTSGQGG